MKTPLENWMIRMCDITISQIFQWILCIKLLEFTVICSHFDFIREFSRFFAILKFNFLGLWNFYFSWSGFLVSHSTCICTGFCFVLIIRLRNYNSACSSFSSMNSCEHNSCCARLKILHIYFLMISSWIDAHDFFLSPVHSAELFSALSISFSISTNSGSFDLIIIYRL